MSKKKTSVPLIQSSIRFKIDLKERVDHAIVDRKTTLQAAVDEALEAWLAAGTRGLLVPPPTINTDLNKTPDSQVHQTVISSDFSREFTEWHEKLEMILKGGQPKAVEAITTNLDAFELLTELAAPHGKGDPDPGKARSNIERGMEQARHAEKESRRLAQDIRDARKGIRPGKSKPARKASGGSGD